MNGRMSSHPCMTYFTLAMIKLAEICNSAYNIGGGTPWKPHTRAHWNERPTAESAEKGPQSGRDENERESHREEERRRSSSSSGGGELRGRPGGREVGRDKRICCCREMWRLEM